MPTVYLETTIPSYLVARPSRDLVIAAHQQITHDWWTTARDRFELYVSEAVLDEIRAGDPGYAAKRLEIVAGLGVLVLSEEVESLIRVYHERLLPVGSARADLPHFAYAVAYKMDFLVTWNCAHLANGQVIRRLLLVNGDIGQDTPVILTPEELLATYPGGEE